MDRVTVIRRSTSLAIVLLFISTDAALGVYTGYETNKFEMKDKVEDGGWTVAWSDDITETDFAEGAGSVITSVLTENPGPFVAWLQQVIQRTLATLAEDAGEEFPDQVTSEIRQLATDAIKAALQTKSTKELTKRLDHVDVKAGAIKYSGANKLWGQTVSKTWGLKVYVALRTKQPQQLLGTWDDATDATEKVVAVLVDDFNNDGFADFGVLNGEKIVCNFNNRADTNNKFPRKRDDGFVGEIRSTPFTDIQDAIPLVADFNNDGFADFGVWNAQGKVIVNFNNRKATDNKFPPVDDDASVGEIRTTPFDRLPNQLPIAADFNNDGFADFGVWQPDGKLVVNFNNRKPTDNKFPKVDEPGYIGEIRTTPSFGREEGDVPIAADFNADGFADFGVVKASGKVLVNFNNRKATNNKFYQQGEHDGFVGEIRTLPFESPDENAVPIVADFNDDGYADFGMYLPNGKLIANFNNRKSTDNKFPKKDEPSFVGEIRSFPY